MTKNISIDNLTKEISKLCENLKAEIILSEVFKKTELTFDDIAIKNKSSFSRPYRKDILKIRENENHIGIELSRNGLYDHLPQGVFHNHHTNTKKLSYSALRKQQKEEENNARQFFSPLENEFFYQKLNIEIKEQNLLDNFINLNEDFLIDFWKLDVNTSKRYIHRFLRLLPYCSDITGNIELTATALEMIIEEKVTIEKTFIEKTANENNPKSNNILGVDFSLSNSGNQYLFPALKITIGPSRKKDINYYIENENLLNFIAIFCDYLIPIDYEVVTNFDIIEPKNFKIDKENPSLLGISSTI